MGGGAGGNGGGGLVTIYSESFSGSNFMASTQGAGLQQKDYGALALAVARTGAGTGTVTSAPAGISCGGDCSELYDGETVTLTATPAPGSTFAGWSGACTNATGDCVVEMTADRTVTAMFDPVSETPPEEQPPSDDPNGSQPTPPLALTLSAAKRQKIGKLQASVTCSRDCHVSLQAAGKSGKRFQSRAAAADLAGGVPTTVRLKLERSVLRKVKGERGSATIVATATDQLGGQAGAETTVKLKR
jgi:uncharacterized repeat protein (TIGR02543 family)